MFRIAPRHLLRQSTLPLAVSRRAGGIRQQSTAVPRRSLKNGLARWAIAIGGTYWYMTSPIFNDEPAYTVLESGDGYQQQSQTVVQQTQSRFKPPHPEDAPVVPSTPTSYSPPSINPKSPDPIEPDAEAVTVDPEHAQALEKEATQQGAFNEETGEINWDCPCLGNMAYGPCGQNFRDAFSCFVYSEDEPKGKNCIEQFESMQNCFREHPEIYAEEIAEDEERTTRITTELESDGGQYAYQEAPAEGHSATYAAGASVAGGYPDVDQPSVWTPTPSEPTRADAKSQGKSG